MGLIFIRFAVVAFQICEIMRHVAKFQKIPTSGQSHQVIDIAADRKRICNFLLVVNSNFGLSRTVF